MKLLDYFKSEKQKELEALLVQEQKLKNSFIEEQLKELSKPKLAPVTEAPDEAPKKPYKKLSLVGNILTVTLHDGTVLTKNDALVKDFNDVRQSLTELAVVNIFTKNDINYTKDKVDEKTKQELLVESAEGFEELKKVSEEFDFRENSVYFKGINRSIPPILVRKLAKIVRESTVPISENTSFLAHKRFFMWCCLNPRAEVVDKLYEFLERNGMQITKQGFFVALRNVVTTKGCDTEFIDFITNVYNKIKAVWKKKPSDYFIYKTEDGYKFAKEIPSGEKDLGNVEKLYLSLPELNENRYTDDWTKTFDIRIGKTVSMPKESCNWSTQDCATAGLHFAGHTAPYVLCGNTTVFTLHNPMKVVGIGTEKGRCWEYLPFMVTTVKEADQIMNSGDFDFLELDEQYAIDELNDLENKVKEGFSEESKKYDFNLPGISTVDIKKIVASLDSMKDTISKRVVNING